MIFQKRTSVDVSWKNWDWLRSVQKSRAFPLISPKIWSRQKESSCFFFLEIKRKWFFPCQKTNRKSLLMPPLERKSFENLDTGHYFCFFPQVRDSAGSGVRVAQVSLRGPALHGVPVLLLGRRLQRRPLHARDARALQRALGVVDRARRHRGGVPPESRDRHAVHAADGERPRVPRQHHLPGLRHRAVAGLWATRDLQLRGVWDERPAWGLQRRLRGHGSRLHGCPGFLDARDAADASWTRASSQVRLQFVLSVWSCPKNCKN